MLRRLLACLSFALAAPFAAAPAAAQTAPAAWVKATSAEGHFTVLMPAAPETRTDPIPDGAGTTTLLLAKPAGGGLWLAGWADYAPGFTFDDQAELERNRDNFIAGIGATHTGTKPHAYGTRPGIEFTAEKAGAFSVRSRVYIIGKRPYQLIAVVPVVQAASPDIDKFLDSFVYKP